MEKEDASQGVTAGGKKIALVCGISKYKSAPLKNPVNDAAALETLATAEVIHFLATEQHRAGQAVAVARRGHGSMAVASARG